MLLCLFGPTALFTLVGYKAMEAVGKRPSDSARVMTIMLVKMVITAAVLFGILLTLLAVFGKTT